jgi:signal peptidase
MERNATPPGSGAAANPVGDEGQAALSDAAEILARAAADHDEADRARARYLSQPMPVLEPDAHIAPLLGPGEDVLAIRHVAFLDRRHRLRSRLITGVVLAFGVAVLAIGITFRVADLHLATVLSNSMRPTFSAGDLVITQAVPMSSVRVGDVITFVPPIGTQVLIHRITSLKDGVITTRGDANSVDDPWQATLKGPTAFRFVGVVPFAGWLTELQRPALLLAGLLIGLAILVELGKGVRVRLQKSQPQPQS